MKRLISFGAIALLYVLASSCAKNPVTGKNDLMLISKEQEIAMGQQADPEIRAFFGVYDDAELQQFINEKGQQMAAISHRPDLKYQFKVVDSPVVNAFAVPGGFVYFTRGIMAHFNNEAEFAGVLGHEIGHIAARHSAKQYSKATLAQIGLVAGSVISPEFAQIADLAGAGVQLLFLKFGRDAETQSDKLGVAYSTKIGYDAREMAGFFSTLDRLSTQSGAQEVPTFLSTHPDPANREKKVTREAENWRKKVSATDLDINRERYLRMIDGIIYGDDPKQGFVENDVFYHPGLRFQFPVPSQWIVQNTPQQVRMGSRDNQAVMILTLAQGNSLEAAAQGVLDKYQFTLVDSRRETVNGLPAVIMIADQRQEQQSVRALCYLIQYGQNIYAIIGASSLGNFDAYARLFQNTMAGFRELTDPDKINRQPERVKIRSVRQSGTLRDALVSLGVGQERIEELATLNGMLLNDRVEQGMLIKVIER